MIIVLFYAILYLGNMKGSDFFMNKDIEKLFSFIVEIDKMKTIYRQTYILAEDRQETDAEHSWHMAIMVPLLSKYSNEPID